MTNYQHTKIVGTIGPASQSTEMLEKMLDIGLSAIRMNFSHGSHEYHGHTIDLVREIDKKRGSFTPIILDTKGPEIRTGKLVDGKPVNLVMGQDIIVTSEEIIGDANKISLTYKSIGQDMKPGMLIMIADGLIRLQVKEVKPNGELLCTVMNQATLGEKKNVNLPGVKVDLPAMSDQDKEDLKFGCFKNVDYIAASFIRKASDVKEIRDFLSQNGGKHIKIISKIENQEGIDNFEEILKETDGIMVARGDLGVDIPLERIPLTQKNMIKRCNEVGKPVITATQMLESMIKNPRPTRAEVTDIANAILDGTDAVMLSGETAGGDYPIEAVTTMKEVIMEIDYTDHHYKEKVKGDEENTDNKQLKITYAIAKGAVKTAEAIKADFVFVASIAGTTVKAIRKYNNSLQPIFVFTPNEQTARQSQLFKSVVGAKIGKADSYEDLYSQIPAIKDNHKITTKSGFTVVVGGGSIGNIGSTDFIKVIS